MPATRVPWTFRSITEFAHMGTDYTLDFTYRAGEYDLGDILFDDGSSYGQPADENSPFYPSLLQAAREAAQRDVEAYQSFHHFARNGR